MKTPTSFATRSAQADRAFVAVSAASLAGAAGSLSAGSAVRQPWPGDASSAHQWPAARRSRLAWMATSAAALCSILAPGIAAAQTFSGPGNVYVNTSTANTTGTTAAANAGAINVAVSGNINTCGGLNSKVAAATPTPARRQWRTGSMRPSRWAAQAAAAAMAARQR